MSEPKRRLHIVMDCDPYMHNDPAEDAAEFITSAAYEYATFGGDLVTAWWEDEQP